jgi:hypothetical protein
MQDHQELLNAIDAAHSASAKRQVLSDLCAFFEKYRRKQDAQLRDISRKYEKVKASGRNDNEALRILTQRNQLQCQIIESLTLEKELLERCLKASDEVEAAYNHLKDLQTRED